MKNAFDGVDPVLGTEELAVFLGTPPGTLRWWRHNGKGPESFRLGKRIAYRRSTVLQWLDEQAAADSAARAS